MSDLIKCEHLTKYYGSKIALSDENLTLESGKIIGLWVRNGSGKNDYDQTDQRTPCSLSGTAHHRRGDAGRQNKVFHLLSPGTDVPGKLDAGE